MADYNAGIKKGLDVGTKDWSAATTCFFDVTISGVKVGAFTGCQGLGVEVTVEKREEGGNNAFVHHLPGRVKYPNIKLSRPINAHSGAVAWLFSEMNESRDRTAEITALAPDGSTVIAQWTLKGVVLVKWTGPSFTVDSAKMLTETLELAHHGFQAPEATS